MSDREGPRATESYSRSWIILLAALVLIGLADFLLRSIGLTVVASVLTAFSIAAVGGFALIDGVWRLFGNEGFLGPGEGVDRFLAFIQIVLTIGALLGLLM